MLRIDETSNTLMAPQAGGLVTEGNPGRDELQRLHVSVGDRLRNGPDIFQPFAVFDGDMTECGRRVGGEGPRSQRDRSNQGPWHGH